MSLLYNRNPEQKLKKRTRDGHDYKTVEPVTMTNILFSKVLIAFIKEILFEQKSATSCRTDSDR